MAPTGWMKVDPVLMQMASEALAGRRPDTAALAGLLENSRDRKQVKRVLRFLRWSASHGQVLAEELAGPLDRRMAGVTGVPGIARVGPKRRDPELASSCISVLPFESPSELRIKWLLALVGWPNRQAAWPKEQWSLNRHAAQAFLRLHKAFGPLVGDPETVAQIEAIAGPDPEERWAAVIDMAGLRISDTLKSRFRDLTLLGGTHIPPDETVPRCPVCRRSSLSYAQVFSPAETWRMLCGREWLVRFCSRCRVIVSDKVIGMN
jgi:hypothetical protein